MLSLAIVGAVSAKTLDAPIPAVDCEPPTIALQGTTATFTLPDISSDPRFDRYMRTARLYVWPVGDDQSLGPLRNETGATAPNVIHVRFEPEDSDQLFRWEAESAIWYYPLNWVDPETGKWHWVTKTVFDCTTAGYIRAPISN